MFQNWRSRIIGILLSVLIGCSLCSARRGPRIEKARVRFLATSWVIRGTWGLNEDSFLAEISMMPDHEPVLARLIDNYSSEFPSLSVETLTSQLGTTQRVMRDLHCDIPFGQLALRTAPGDLMAVLPQRLVYDPPLARTPNAQEILPCYRLARK